MYVARGSMGTPSSGVWVFMNRRCRWASSRAKIASFGWISLSSHGEYQPTGLSSSGVWKMSSAQIICTHVVPVLDRVLITMSPSRNGKPSHRALSSSGETYLTVFPVTRRA